MYKEGFKGWVKHLDFVFLDVFCLQISLLLSYALYNNAEFAYSNLIYRKLAVILMFLDFVVIFFQEIYKNVLKRGYYREFVQIIKQSFFVLLSLVFVLFITKEAKDYSRVIIVLTFSIYIPTRFITSISLKTFILKSENIIGKNSIIIITNERVSKEVIKNLQENNFSRYDIRGIIILDKDMKGQHILGVPVVENIDNASDYIGKEWVDEILIAKEENIECPVKLIQDIKDAGLTLHEYLASSNETTGEKQFVEKLGNYSVLTTTINTMTTKQAFFKRLLDIIGGLVGCIATLFITIIIGPIIYISSPGPIFFSQTRVGKNGKTFKMYKFRSMYMDAEERKAELLKNNKIKDGMMFKLDFDPRVIGNKILPNGKKKTGIGQFIRDTSLDEFPQFFNVLIGNMSLVGVRPCLLDEWEKYEVHHRTRATVKPGITGMWQVSGRSEITDFEEVVKLDREYVNNWSLDLDIKILLKTIKVVLTKDGSM